MKTKAGDVLICVSKDGSTCGLHFMKTEFISYFSLFFSVNVQNFYPTDLEHNRKIFDTIQPTRTIKLKDNE